MAPPKRSTDTATTDLITIINSNWSLRLTTNCLTKSLFPKGLSDRTQWGLPTLNLLAQISALPGVNISDFRAKLKEAIAARQARDKSAAGNVGYMTVADLRAVLKRYQEEEKEADATEEIPHPAKAKAKGRAGRPEKDTGAGEDIAPPKAPKARGRPRKNLTTVPKTPIRPIEEDEDDEEEEEDSEAPLAGGKYQYLERVRPVKVNLNPDASVAAKPLRRKPAPRTKAVPRGRKRCQNADGDDVPDPRAAKRPSLVVEDSDPRVPDDTGFLSPLVATPEKRKGKKRSTRLSRLQENRIREPHWQHGVPLEMDEEVAVDSGDAAPTEAEDVVMEDVVMEDADLEEVLQGLEEIPDEATVSERLDMEELRLSIEQRIWRIKALRIQQRAETKNDGETAAQVDTHEPETTYATRSGRTLRTRRGKR
jgi:hypothetical protein